MSHTLYYISDVAPNSGGGGGIIVHRHLEYLATQGWQIEVVTPEGGQAIKVPPACRSFRMPARKWYWPPFRTKPEALLELRLWLCAAYLQKQSALAEKPAAVLTVCTGPASLLAAKVAHKLRCPLLTVVHDWWGESDAAVGRFVGERVCALSHKILCVSEEMKTLLSVAHGAEKCELLYPVPAARIQTFATWHETHRTAPVIAHVGALHEYHFGYLKCLAEMLETKGGRLLLLCAGSNPVLTRLRAVLPNLWHQEYFPTNEQALQFIGEQATGLTVMYPYGQLASGLPPTGFPSRLVEFTQLGLPTLLAAPEKNPIRSWAAARNWTAACDPSATTELHRFLEGITQRESWDLMAVQSRAAAETDFSPTRIHRQLQNLLEGYCT